MSSSRSILRALARANDDPKIVVYGFPLSTYVNIVRLILTHKNVAFEFQDIETKMNGADHLALHPFNRVPILDHNGFKLYETFAIALYVDETFAGPRLQPRDKCERAKMLQWMSALNSYYYPYAVQHLGHERLIFPPLGIASDERVVAAALPKIDVALDVLERELEHGANFLVSVTPTLADFFMLPTMTALSLVPEGQSRIARRVRVTAWLARMGALPSVIQARAAITPHIGKPVEHARRWIEDHRPYYGGENYKPFYGG